MTEGKRCFLDKDRPCDLTCKAAFEVDDPVDNVDCYFIWLAHHLGEGLFDIKGMIGGMTGQEFPTSPPGGGPGTPGAGPKDPKNFPSN